MRPGPDYGVERYRITQGELASNASWGCNGAFCILNPFGPSLNVIASDGAGWDHVSVSLRDRCPTWPEMCYVKDLFFLEEECVLQFHPAKADYVNQHPNCLHLWRPQGKAIEMPPKICV